MLFEVIPDHFFRVFSGPRRHINAHLIKRLYDVYYGDDSDLEVPLASEVRAFLISEIRTLPGHLQQTLNRDGAPASPETEGHEFFRKLVTSYKWLKITRDLGKKFVQFTAVAHTILDFFMGLRSALSEDFTIDLAGILSSLETTVNKSDPHACLSAQKQSRELVKKLKALNTHDSLGMGLICLDEVMNKTDSPNMRRFIDFLVRIGLQPIMAAPGKERSTFQSRCDTVTHQAQFS